MKKTILITGSSTGIGKVTALYFANKGWNVAASMRNPSKAGNEFNQPNIKIIQIDVLNEQQIKAGIAECIDVFGGIDVVFNNAGYALVGAFEAMTDEQIRKQFDTNVFGVMNVTRAILPYFRGKNEGVIINTSSMGGLITFPLYSVYHATKWALEGFMESLQFELKGKNIRIKNIEPGAIKTDFENSLNFVSNDDYKDYAPRVHQNMLDTYKTAPGADVVAKRVFEAAIDSGFSLRYPVGGFAPVLLFLRRLLPGSWFRRIVSMSTEK
jgi:NAD(P)-dependent dehydrogenase (short-subunit alcohol dehydrogenase family)